MFILSIEIHLLSSILMGYKIIDYSILSLNEVVTRRATFFKFAAALDAMASLKWNKEKMFWLKKYWLHFYFSFFFLKRKPSHLIRILKNGSSGRNIDQYYRIPIWPIVIVGLWLFELCSAQIARYRNASWLIKIHFCNVSLSWPYTHVH